MRNEFNEQDYRNQKSVDFSLQEVLVVLKDWINYLKTKLLFIAIFGLLGAVAGLSYALTQKTLYVSKLTFALEEDKGSGGLTGAIGLASSLGIDLGTSAGGAFMGGNLIELMKSRTIVEKALLNPIFINNQSKSLAQYYIEYTKMNENWANRKGLADIQFLPNAERSKFSRQQDSILGLLYSNMTGINGLLNVTQKDKKISILTIEVKCEDELFAKAFTENIAKEVSGFYIDTKIKKSKANVDVLQKQSDSIRNELNAAITGVAVANDNTFNLNPAIYVHKTSSLKRQIDVQANTAILTQLVSNLELARISLRKETPLIQIIDKPILPLNVEKVSKSKMMIIGGSLSSVFIIMFFVCRRWIKGLVL